MTDLTDEQVRALADGYPPENDNLDWAERAQTLARALLDARAELARVRADAQAAVALVVERAATAVSLNAWRHEGEDAYSKGMDAGARHQAQVIYNAIRALAPADGLAAVDALRAEARENAMQALASMGQAQDAYEAQLEAEAELAAAQQREAELRGALEMSRQGWRNALELDLLPKQHRHSAKTMADIADAALASVDGLAMVQALRAERDTLAAENARIRAAKAVAG